MAGGVDRKPPQLDLGPVDPSCVQSERPGQRYSPDSGLFGDLKCRDLKVDARSERQVVLQ